LTIAELWRIAESFRFSLVNMLHARVAYPKRDDREAPTPEKREQKSAA
jgi:membrane-associated HD superfamily phosphohydrolase